MNNKLITCYTMSNGNNGSVKIKIGGATVKCLVKFNLDSQNCSLCRKTLNLPPKEELRTIGIDIHPNVTVTKCRHGFHNYCLQSHINAIEENQPTECPACGSMYSKKDMIITSSTVTDIKYNP